MSHSASYEKLGRFIIEFQHVEAGLTELLVLLAKADDEIVRVLVNELEFSQRAKTTDVVFARFVDVRRDPDEEAKREFHRLVVELLELGQRRNDIVHSTYFDWTDASGATGVLRRNSKLRASRGTREEEEEELLPQAFDTDFARLSKASEELERFRLKVIDWLHPNESPNNAFETDRDISWPHRARHGLSARRCGNASCPAAQLGR